MYYGVLLLGDTCIVTPGCLGLPLAHIILKKAVPPNPRLGHLRDRGLVQIGAVRTALDCASRRLVDLDVGATSRELLQRAHWKACSHIR